MNQVEFNELFRNRTKKMALAVIRLYGKIPKSDETRIIGRQLMRSATSVAANYRAVCRARSEKERFAKLSIVVEEADETLFWLEILEESKLVNFKLDSIKKEATEILKVMATIRRKLKK